MKIHLVTPVWGQEFTRVYLSLVLPNQLAAGNLPALAARAQPVYKIYTRSQDAAVIAADPCFRRVTALMTTELIALDHLFGASATGNAANGLLTMTAAHRAGVDAANAAGAALMFLPPDQLYSDGAFARCLELAERGARAVVLPGLRFVKEGLEPILGRRRDAANGDWGESARTLLTLSLPHLSPIARAMFANANPFTDAPSHVYFPVQDQGFVARALHLHLLFMLPRRRVPLRYGNFDTDYLLDACPAAGDYHIVSDSDEIVAVELSPAAKQLGQAGTEPLNVLELAAFYRLFGNRLLLGFLRTPLYVHSSNVTPQWHEVARRSDEVIGRARSPWTRLKSRLGGNGM